MATTADAGLHSAVLLLGAERGHQLLGCDWGTLVALPSDREACLRQARRRMVVHDHGQEYALKLCSDHFALVEAHTDPHTEEVP